MPIPSQKDIQIILLHLIHHLGGQIEPSVALKKLAKYFGLTEEERQQLQPSGYTIEFYYRYSRAMLQLCHSGFLDKSTLGIWKITEKGRRELSRLGLIDKPFPADASLQDQGVLPSTKGAQPKSDDEEILQLVLEEVAQNGSKKFPEDFLNSNYSDFYEVELPGTQLHLAPLSQTTITSPRGYFRYQAKNPSEAKYILYCYKVGLKKVKIPSDNLTLFKTVTAYEKYCDEIMKKSFELFLGFTNDEEKAEHLSNEIASRLDLRAKRN